MGTKLYHPRFPSITQDVQDTEPWLAAGWIPVPVPPDGNMDTTTGDGGETTTD